MVRFNPKPVHDYICIETCRKLHDGYRSQYFFAVLTSPKLTYFRLGREPYYLYFDKYSEAGHTSL